MATGAETWPQAPGGVFLCVPGCWTLVSLAHALAEDVSWFPCRNALDDSGGCPYQPVSDPAWDGHCFLCFGLDHGKVEQLQCTLVSQLAALTRTEPDRWRWLWEVMTESPADLRRIAAYDRLQWQAGGDGGGRRQDAATWYALLIDLLAELPQDVQQRLGQLPLMESMLVDWWEVKASFIEQARAAFWKQLPPTLALAAWTWATHHPKHRWWEHHAVPEDASAGQVREEEEQAALRAVVGALVGLTYPPPYEATAAAAVTPAQIVAAVAATRTQLLERLEQELRALQQQAGTAINTGVAPG